MGESRGWDPRLTRKQLLARTGQLGLVAGLSGVLAACGGGGTTSETAPAESVEETAATTGAATTQSQTVPVGDIEVAGIGGTGTEWWQAMAKAYTTETGNNVKILEQSLSGFIPAWKAAVAAKKTPDLQYLWEGIYTLEDAWAGNLLPWDDYVPPEEIDHWLARQSTTWDGHVWNSPSTLDAAGMVLNRKLFEQAGLDAEEPLNPWDHFLDVCATLKSADIVPICFGLKDAFGGSWWWADFGRAHLDSITDILDAVQGQQDFGDEKFTEWIYRLDEMAKAGYFNDDILSLNLFDSFKLFAQDKAAMIVGVPPILTSYFEDKGEDAIVTWDSPTFGEGALTKRVSALFDGGTVLPKYETNPEVAADFIAFTRRPENLTAFYEAHGTMRGDDRLDASVLKHEWQKDLYERFQTGNYGPFIEDWIPVKLDSEGIQAGVQLVLTGEGPDAAVKAMTDTLEKWRRESPAAVEAYATWAANPPAY